MDGGRNQHQSNRLLFSWRCSDTSYLRKMLIPIVTLTFLIFVVMLLIFILTSNGASTPSLPSIINRSKKVDGVTTHKKRVNFDDAIQVMRYDTITGNSLGLSRDRLALEKGVTGSHDTTNPLDDLLKIAGTLKKD